MLLKISHVAARDLSMLYCWCSVFHTALLRSLHHFGQYSMVVCRWSTSYPASQVWRFLRWKAASGRFSGQKTQKPTVVCQLCRLWYHSPKFLYSF